MSVPVGDIWCSDEKNIVVSATSTDGAESKLGLLSSLTGTGVVHGTCRLVRVERQKRPRNGSRSLMNQIARPSNDTDGERSTLDELSSSTWLGTPQASVGLARRDTQMSRLGPAR